MRGRIDSDVGSSQTGMKVRPPLDRLPPFLQRHILHFEAQIDRKVRQFALELPPKARVLDAGAGECQYAEQFEGLRYTAVDLGIGDAAWSYARLHALANLLLLPFADNTFEAALNVVTLEHVTDPAKVIAELFRCLKPGGRLLLITPLEWEEHQQPHDFLSLYALRTGTPDRARGIRRHPNRACRGIFPALVEAVDEFGTVLPRDIGDSAGGFFRAARALPSVPRYTRQEA